MKNSIINDIKESMQKKTTKELIKIINDKDMSKWREEAFDIIEQILSERNIVITQIQNFEIQRNIKGLIEIVISTDRTDISDCERKEAADVLGRIRAIESVEYLIKVINNQSMSYSIRSNAIRALGEIKSPKAVKQLFIVLYDPIESIHEEALEALKKIAEIQGEIFIENKNSNIKAVALEVIKQIRGAEAQKTLEYFKLTTIGKMKKEFRKLGVGLIILGIAHLALKEILDPFWGVIIIVLGFFNLVVSKRIMFTINGLSLLLVGFMNIFNSLSNNNLSFWFSLGIMQLIWGVIEIKRYFNYEIIK